MRTQEELVQAREKLIAVLTGNIPSPFSPEAEDFLVNMNNVISWVLEEPEGEVISVNLATIDILQKAIKGGNSMVASQGSA